MDFLLVPISGGGMDDAEAGVGGYLMHLVTGIFISIAVTEKLLPDIHGWLRFFICLAITIVFMVLSMLPIIGTIIAIVNGFMWIGVCWVWVAAIPFAWLMWTLRIIALIFFGSFELMFIVSRY